MTAQAPLCFRRRPKTRWVTPEGYQYIALGGLLTFLAAQVAGLWLALPFSALSFYLVLFFRNPARRIPEGENWVTAPADGRILDVTECKEAPYLKGPAKRIAIFMSPLNCHMNRSPIAGRVKACFYQRGTFRAAFRPKAMEHNEHHAILLEGERGERWLVVQMAGWLARRIVSYVRGGEWLVQGERFGLIQFGSRTDLYCPLHCDIRVKPGQKVYAGQTILGRIR